MNDGMSTEPRYCPFCGSKAQVKAYSRLRGTSWEVIHENLDDAVTRNCPMLTHYYDMKDEAIDELNERIG